MRLPLIILLLLLLICGCAPIVATAEGVEDFVYRRGRYAPPRPIEPIRDDPYMTPN